MNLKIFKESVVIPIQIEITIIFIDRRNVTDNEY